MNKTIEEILPRENMFNARPNYRDKQRKGL